MNMTQQQLDLICKIIDNGAPALAPELRAALSGLVQAYNALSAENEELKTKLNATIEVSAVESDAE